MNKPLKILCTLISVLLCLTFYVPAAHADGINGIYTSEISVKQGDDFFVYIHIPENDIDAQSLSLRVDFDPDVFEITYWQPELDIPSYLQFYSVDNEQGYFNLTTATSATEIDLSEGLTLYAAARAKTNASLGRYMFALSEHYMFTSYNDPESGELVNLSLWEPEVTSMGVTVTQGSYIQQYPVRGGGISVSQYALNKGDTFNVIINIPASRTADSAYLLVSFDSSAFDVITWMPNIAGASAYTGSGYFSLSANNSSALIDLTYGMSLYATLRVKDTAANSSYNLRLEKADFTYYDTSKRDNVSLWTPQETLTSVSVYSNNNQQNNNQPVIVPEVTTSTQWNYPYSYTTRNYSDEIDYSEGIDPEKAVTTTRTTTRGTNDDTDPDDDPDSYDIVNLDNDNYYPDEDDPDDEHGTDTADYDNNSGNTVSGKGSVSLDCSKLKGLSSGGVVLTTKNSFFTGTTQVIMTNTEYAEVCARDALNRLGLSNHICYPFDISLFNTDTNRYATGLANGGYLELEMPLPAEMIDNPQEVEVFHIADGMPESLNRNIVYSGGQTRIRFRVSSFSPFMFVDMSRENAADTTRTPVPDSGYVSVDDPEGDAELIMDAGYVPHNGSLNPNTGVAAAIIIPSAVGGCVFLARKSSKRRKRAKSNIDESEEDE